MWLWAPALGNPACKGRWRDGRSILHCVSCHGVQVKHTLLQPAHELRIEIGPLGAQGRLTLKVPLRTCRGPAALASEADVRPRDSPVGSVAEGGGACAAAAAAGAWSSEVTESSGASVPISSSDMSAWVTRGVGWRGCLGRTASGAAVVLRWSCGMLSQAT